VGVSVAAGELIDAMAKEIEHGMLDPLVQARVAEGGSDARCETEFSVELSQQKQTAVGGECATRRASGVGAGENGGTLGAFGTAR
jgi:hypothetical protein